MGIERDVGDDQFRDLYGVCFMLVMLVLVLDYLTSMSKFVSDIACGVFSGVFVSYLCIHLIALLLPN
jgi:hypothetical protein